MLEGRGCSRDGITLGCGGVNLDREGSFSAGGGGS
jgi:hypothetical protein